MLLTEITTLYDMVSRRAAEQGQAQVILAPQRTPLTYTELFDHVTAIGRTLRACGVERNGPVAIVLPEGPEIMVGLLGVASFATAAPLNPKYLREEFARYLSELEAQLLIVGGDENPQAIAAARAANLPVLRLSLSGPRAGLTGLDGAKKYEEGLLECDPAQPDDIALLAHTSGTTGRPKIVPLTQRNLHSATRGLVGQLPLEHGFRNLNVFPMFHANGLISSYCVLLAGGSQICAPGFDPARFFDWLEEFQPVSFACAPSMFSLLLTLAEKHPSTTGYGYLRYISSGSAALSPDLLARIEATFGVTVADSYSSTEAVGMASSGTKAIPHRAGSVGKALNSVIDIMDGNGKGEFLPPGQRGEVVVRGPNVMAGYWHNPEANAEAFRNGWFCTGDYGYLDEDGYLFLTGRIKELINRGGEKISPYEVEQALLAYPAVAEAAAFAIPNPILGEAVAAALVLKPDQTVTEAELRSFLVEQITYFKIPSRFIFVSALPKNQVGKVERLSLAALYGLDTLPLLPAPGAGRVDKPLGGSVEAAIFQIWSEVLDLTDFGLDHNFFDLGGTSLTAASMVTLVHARLARLVTVTTLVEYPTLRLFSLAVRRANPLSEQGGPLQPLTTEGDEPPFFIVHGAEGYSYHYNDLAKLLAPDIPVYAFTSIGRPGMELLEFEVPRLAKIYIAELRKVQPHGPYRLAGHSGGGLLILEMAAQLRKQGETIAFLGMFDSQAPGLWQWYTPLQHLLQRKPIPFLARLASALQPEAYVFLTAKLEDGSFSEERAAKMNWLEVTWYLWQYLRRKRGRSLPKVGTLPGEVIRKIPVKYRSLIWDLSSLSVWHQAQEIIKYLQAHPESMQQNDIKGLVRAAWQGLHTRGLFVYRVRPYSGEVVIFQIEEDSMVKLDEWRRIVKGPIQLHKVKGDHGNHIRLPYAVEVSRVLRTYLQRP